jgi:hypothetical protein
MIRSARASARRDSNPVVKDVDFTRTKKEGSTLAPLLRVL